MTANISITFDDSLMAKLLLGWQRVSEIPNSLRGCDDPAVQKAHHVTSKQFYQADCEVL